MEQSDQWYRRGDVTIAYIEFGNRPERTFVLVHGIGMGRTVFTGVAEILAAEGRVLTLDLPGFGDSPEPGSAFTIAQTAEVLAEFVTEQSSGNTTLVGHSMGTQIVAEIACHHPALLDSLVLIAPTVNRHERTASQQVARMLQDLTGESLKVMLTGLWQYLKTNPFWFVRKLRLMLNHRLEELCPDIATPTLLLRGETDRVCPRGWVAEITVLFPDATMKEIAGRGHEAIINSPEPVASMIRDFVVDTAGSY